MAEWWDWTSKTADRDEAIRQSRAAQLLAKTEADYDREVQKIRDAQTKAYALRGGTAFDSPQPGFYRSLPPEARMAAMWEAGALTPKSPNPGASRFMGEVARWPLEIFSRPRDTAVRAAQEAAQGNALGALGYAASVAPSMLVPALAAGRPGDEDDWQESGRRMGVSERDLLILDQVTDPVNYLTLGAGGSARRLAVQGMSRGDDLLRALRGYAGRMRYGEGAPAYLEDASGGVLARLRNAPGGTVAPLALPAP